LGGVSEQSVQWKTRRLGARAHDHFRDVGCPAGLALGGLLTSVVTADRFSAMTYAPEEVDAARLVENMNWSLSSAGAPDRRRRGPSPMAWVIARIAVAIATPPGATLVAPDPMSPVITPREIESVGYETDTYYVLRPPELSPEAVALVIAAASNAWTQIAVVTRAAVPTGQFSLTDLEAVARECTQVVHQVYDQESWLVLDGTTLAR
jgi:hypothetical protein